MGPKKQPKVVNAVEEWRDEEADPLGESSDEEMLHIRINMQSGKSFHLDLWMYDTVGYMKSMIMEHEGKGLDDMRVYIGSRELRDEYTLQHQRVKDEVWVVHSTGPRSSSGVGAPAASTGATPSSSGVGAPVASTGATPSSSGIRIRGSAGASSSSGVGAPVAPAGATSSSSGVGAPVAHTRATSSIIDDPVISDILLCLDNLNARLRRVEEQLQHGP
jgi:hypothetical protein